ncbi:MAG: aldehyde dehydrogenase family protein, partial [Candidatus Kariarchaeum pelagius]
NETYPLQQIRDNVNTISAINGYFASMSRFVDTVTICNDIINNNNPDPLALYIFSEDKKFINSLKENIQCGDININDVLQHVAIPGMKFGGVKSSGLGGYGGQFGFDQFSHKRSVFHRSTLFINNLAQPPYTTMKERLLKLFYR